MGCNSIRHVSPSVLTLSLADAYLDYFRYTPLATTLVQYYHVYYSSTIMLARPNRKDDEQHSNTKHLARRVTQMRTALGFSQEVLARKAGLSVYTVSKIEQERSIKASVFTVDALARALDTTVDDLLHGSERNQAPVEAQSAKQDNSARSKRAQTANPGRKQSGD